MKTQTHPPTFRGPLAGQAGSSQCPAATLCPPPCSLPHLSVSLGGVRGRAPILQMQRLRLREGELLGRGHSQQRQDSHPRTHSLRANPAPSQWDSARGPGGETPEETRKPQKIPSPQNADLSQMEASLTAADTAGQRTHNTMGSLKETSAAAAPRRPAAQTWVPVCRGARVRDSGRRGHSGSVHPGGAILPGTGTGSIRSPDASALPAQPPAETIAPDTS